MFAKVCSHSSVNHRCLKVSAQADPKQRKHPCFWADFSLPTDLWKYFDSSEESFTGLYTYERAVQRINLDGVRTVIDLKVWICLYHALSQKTRLSVRLKQFVLKFTETSQVSLGYDYAYATTAGIVEGRQGYYLPGPRYPLFLTHQTSRHTHKPWYEKEDRTKDKRGNSIFGTQETGHVQIFARDHFPLEIFRKILRYEERGTGDERDNSYPIENMARIGSGVLKSTKADLMKVEAEGSDYGKCSKTFAKNEWIYHKIRGNERDKYVNGLGEIQPALEMAKYLRVGAAWGYLAIQESSEECHPQLEPNSQNGKIPSHQRA